MKFLVLLIVSLLGIMGFAFSTKRKPSVHHLSSLSGEWRGSYSVDEGPFVNLLLISFEDDQHVKIYEGEKEWGDEAAGTYILSGDTLTMKYIYKNGIQNEVKVKARLNSNHTMKGNWEWIKGKGKLIARESGTRCNNKIGK